MAAGRVPHIIRPNASGGAPGAYIALAITTTPTVVGERKVRHDFATASAIYWRPARQTRLEALEYATFESVQSLLQWADALLGRKERIAMAAYDMDFVAQVCDFHCELRNLGYRPTRLVIEKGRWVQRWKEGVTKEFDGTRSILLFDLLNFFPTPLRNLAKWLSLPYPSEAGNDASWLTTEDGCKWRSTVTLRALQLWLDFRTRFDLGYFAPTLAGQAFNTYRHRFMSIPIYVHCHSDVSAIEQEANYGGRVAAPFRGRAPKGHYVQVDVTSFYGSVMRGNQFPIKQVGHTRRIGLRNLNELLANYCIVARCTIRTEVPAYPKREAERVDFPIGRFTTTLCTPEIQLALRRGDLESVEEVVVYERGEIFNDYVDFFWNLRLAAMRTDDTHIVELAKRFLVALYGKFGQKIWLSTLVRDDAVGEDKIWREYDWQDRMEYEYRIIAGRMERAEREMLGRDAFLAIPAHVTSYGRVRLWELMEKAGREHIYYVDTDSFIGSDFILQNLGDEFADKTLGGLRLVRASSHLFIRAPKWYILGDTTRRAGIPTGARETSWNVFEGQEQRSMHWALAHDSPCQAVVEHTSVHGPLQHKLSTRDLGHFVEPLRIGETPTRLPGGALSFPLPGLLNPPQA